MFPSHYTAYILYKIFCFKIITIDVHGITILLGVQLCFRRSFSEIRGFIVKN